MDGTIVDVPYDWSKIRSELETQGKPILVYLQNLSEPEKSRKWAILEKFEEKATKAAVLKEGIPEFLAFLGQHGIKTALVSNNSQKNEPLFFWSVVTSSCHINGVLVSISLS